MPMESCVDLYKIKYLKHTDRAQTWVKFSPSGVPQLDACVPPVFGVFSHKIAFKHSVTHFVHPSAHLAYLV